MAEECSDVAGLIAQRQAQLGLSDTELAAAVGYHKPNVIAMIKKGAIRVPLNKASQFAETLQVSRMEMVKGLLLEYAPDLWSSIQDLFPVGELTGSEVNLIRHLRKLSKGNAASTLVLDGADVIALVATQR